MAVSREILTTDISGTVTPTSGQMTLSEHINWSDVPARLQEIFAPTTGSGIFATELDPYFGLWRAQSVTFKPRTPRMDADVTVQSESGDDVVLPSFDKAILDITYSSLEQQSPTSQDDADQDGEGDPVPFLTHSWSIGGDFITMDDTAMFWSSGDSAKATGIAANKIIPTIEHSINWKRVLYPPFNAIRECLGKVNSRTMTFSTGRIYPECLLFNGAELSRDIMSDGARAWDLTYRFSERRVDAVEALRMLYDAGTPGYDPNDNDYRALAYDGVPVTQVYLDPPGKTVPVAGRYGGWNHFYKKDNPSGMYRLHQSRPPHNSSWNFYMEANAIYKQYDLLKLFEQDS